MKIFHQTILAEEGFKKGCLKNFGVTKVKNELISSTFG